MSDVYYQVYGQGTPLVLLHGWGMNGAIWQPIIANLSERHCLYVIDLPGFGLSPFPNEKFCLTTICEKILKVVPEKAHWLGWSLGGLVAISIAAVQPQRVLSLINVASTPQFIQAPNWPGLEISILEKFRGLLTQDFRATLQRFLALQVLGASQPQILLHEIKELLKESPEPSPKALLAGLQLLINTDLRSDFSKLSCPILSILGNLDALVPRALAPVLADLNPYNRVIMMPKASHMPFLSHTTQFCSNVNEFIEKNE